MAPDRPSGATEAGERFRRTAARRRVRATVSFAGVAGTERLDEAVTFDAIDVQNTRVSAFVSRRKWDCLVVFDRNAGTVVVDVAAGSVGACERRTETIRRLLDFRSVGNTVPVKSYHQRDRYLVDVTCEEWVDIQDNYVPTVRDAIAEVVKGPPPGHSGRLIVWAGPPGTGKTTALGALIRGWHHAGFDIEVQSGDPGGTCHRIERYTVGGGPDRPVLVVIEEGGELLTSPGEDVLGNQLGRRASEHKVLLDIGDGLIGRSANVFVVITTNLPLGSLDAAALRAGRCLSVVDFRKFDRHEAGAWLGRNDVAVEMSLGELFVAQRTGVLPPTAPSSDHYI